MRSEQSVVEAVVGTMCKRGFEVVTEVPNFHRSADIAAVDKGGEVWVIECKVSAMSRAIDQMRTHRVAADRVAIATPSRRVREDIQDMLREEGIGLLLVSSDGSVTEELEAAPQKPWGLARDRLRQAILELTSC